MYPSFEESFFLISSMIACRFLRVRLNLVLSQNLGNRSARFFLQKLNQAFSESIDSNSPTILMVMISLSDKIEYSIFLGMWNYLWFFHSSNHSFHYFACGFSCGIIPPIDIGFTINAA